MSAPIAPDDIVRSEEEAQGNSRPPLLMLDPLEAFPRVAYWLDGAQTPQMRVL